MSFQSFVNCDQNGVWQCVCDYHQNANLLISALPTKIDYKELLKRTVCDKDNRNYMLHGCEYCPGEHVLKTFLTDLFENEDEFISSNGKNNVIRQYHWYHYNCLLMNLLQKSFITKAEWASF